LANQCIEPSKVIVGQANEDVRRGSAMMANNPKAEKQIRVAVAHVKSSGGFPQPNPQQHNTI
jgi:hypothetical protein